MKTAVLKFVTHGRRIVPALIFSFALGGCAIKPPEGIEPVRPFAVQSYLGTWYEIARLDHSFERGMTHVTAEYRLNQDDSLKVINRGYNTEKQAWNEANGHALFTGPTDQGALKVSFFGPFYGGYFVADLDKDYRWSLVVGPNRDYFWILSREPRLSEELKAELVAKAQALGIDTTQLIWVKQTQPVP
jgi:apolipoprotein D and lipocalin family protein